MNINVLKPHHSLWILLFICSISAVNCNELPADMNVDNYITFLEITPEQKPEILPILEKIRDIYIGYQSTLKQAQKSEKTNADSIAKWKYEMVEQLHPSMRDMKLKLTQKQRSVWAQSEAYYYFQNSREDVIKYITKHNPPQDQKKVLPGSLTPVSKGFTPQKPIEQWTIFLSELRGNAFTRTQGGSAGFPIQVQATLMDQSLRKDEEQLPSPFPEGINPESVIEIRVILQTGLHQNYIDISRWTPFISIPGGTDIEPIKIAPRDKAWFEERGITRFRTLPDFLLSNDVYIPEEPSSGGFGGLPRTIMTPPSSFPMSRSTPGLFQQYTAYYQLFFPAEANGEKIIAPPVKSIKLTFIESPENPARANGTWQFIWPKK
jgi:hypothetical protein